MSFENGAPMTRFLGVNDLSTTQPVIDPEAIPTHLPKVYIFAKEGPTSPQLVVGDSRSQTFNTDSFDLRNKWANHATVLCNTINAKGNFMMLQRVVPDDAAPRANVRLSLDVLRTQIDDYQRNDDGTFAVDQAGNYIPTGQKINGIKAKWVTEYVPLNKDGTSNIGMGEETPGDQVDATGSVQSKRYPIFDLEVSHIGAYGNDVGFRVWAPTTKSNQPVDSLFIQRERAYPFRMACIRRADINSSAKIVATNYAEQYVEVCLKPGSLNRVTEKEMYVGTEFIANYQSLQNSDGTPPQWGPFGQIHVYDDVLNSLLSEFYALELPLADLTGDFTHDADEVYRFNIFGGCHSNGVPYHSYELVVDASNAIRLGEITNLYATGGSDGTLTDDVFAKLVAGEVAAYADPNSPLMDDAFYPESIMYDSGFPLETKYAMINFIAIRKDTAVVLSTHTVGGKTLSASEESALAIALRTRLQMFPESSYYGTMTLRGVVVGRSGILINSQYRKRLPLTIELASKAADYMGAGNGKWKSGYSFDRAPNNQIRMFSDVNVTFTPASVRNKDWDNGLVWVESYDRRALFFPALKTVYGNDTSILTSFFNMLICVELQKVGARAHREFTGADTLTNAQLINNVEKFITDKTTDRFDGRVVIQPNVTITSADATRGYSWSTAIRLYGPNMKTVQTLTVEALRLDNLVAAA